MTATPRTDMEVYGIKNKVAVLLYQGPGPFDASPYTFLEYQFRNALVICADGASMEEKKLGAHMLPGWGGGDGGGTDPGTGGGGDTGGGTDPTPDPELPSGPLTVSLSLTGPLPDWENSSGTAYRVQALSYRHRQYSGYWAGELSDDAGQTYAFRSGAVANELLAGEFTLFPRTSPQVAIYRPHGDNPNASRTVGMVYRPTQVVRLPAGMTDAQADAPALEYLAWPTGNKLANEQGTKGADLLLSVLSGQLRQRNGAMLAPGGAGAAFYVPLLGGLDAYSLTVGMGGYTQGQTDYCRVELPNNWAVDISQEGTTLLDTQGNEVQFWAQAGTLRSVILDLDPDGVLQVTPYSKNVGSAESWYAGNPYISGPGVGVTGDVVVSFTGALTVEQFSVTPGSTESYPYGLTPPSADTGGGGDHPTAPAGTPERQENGDYTIAPYLVSQDVRPNGDVVSYYDFTNAPAWYAAGNSSSQIVDANGNDVGYVDWHEGTDPTPYSARNLVNGGPGYVYYWFILNPGEYPRFF